MGSDEYRAKAIGHLILAEHEPDIDKKVEQLHLALGYMRLAQLAEKNALTDLVYETPAPATQPVRQQQQQQQAQQTPPPGREQAASADRRIMRNLDSTNS
jgi:hypothetical protein